MRTNSITLIRERGCYRWGAFFKERRTIDKDVRSKIMAEMVALLLPPTLSIKVNSV